MMARTAMVLLLVLATFVFSSPSTPTTGNMHIFMESQPSASTMALRTDLVKRARAHPDATHDVLFVIKDRNMDVLTQAFHDVSDPASPRYGQHWTPEQVAALTANPAGRDAVIAYLRASAPGATVLNQTLHGEVLLVRGTVRALESLFHTEFYNYHRVLRPDHDMGDLLLINRTEAQREQQRQRRRRLTERAYVRAERYSLPAALHAHVLTVLHTVQMPLPLPAGASLRPDYEAMYTTHTAYPAAGARPSRPADTVTVTMEGSGVTTQATVPAGIVQPATLAKAYNVDSNVGSAAATQCVFSSVNQYFSPRDLATFQRNNLLPLQPVTTVIGGGDVDSVCASNANNCVEGNLDVQYLVGTCTASPTTWWYTDDQSFADFFVAVYNTPAPPKVYSLSYSTDELYLQTSGYSEIQVFDSVALKLGVMGVTIVAAAGDNGVMTSNPVSPPTCYRGYQPQFPASSPYVLAVGATMGIESGVAETVCMSDKGGVITSGGGFSNYYPTPAWQAAQVAGYFKAAAAAGTMPAAGYATGTRGYPDVALTGMNYQYIIAGTVYKGSGTSASTPVVAGFISLVNAARIAAGQSALGFVNPALYAPTNYPKFVNDVTSGINSCYVGSSSAVVCCPVGFPAVAGWDPSSGLGSINFLAFKQTMLGVAATTAAPSATPAAVPLYLYVNGVAYADYSANSAAFKKQVQYAVAYILTLPLTAVVISGVGAYSRRALLGTSGQSVVVQTTVTTSSTSKQVVDSVNNAIGNGLFTAVLTTGYQTYGGVATATATQAAVAGTAPSSALTATTPASGNSGSGSGGGSKGFSGCFAATEQVTLEDGATKAMADVVVGDRILTVNEKTGAHVYSAVVAVPHGKNAEKVTFAVVTTASGRDVKMTANHMLPAGACSAAGSLPVVSASSVSVGECVETVSGRERVVSVSSVEGRGIYTAIAMEELLVVNGVVATPYGGVNPALANAYYNLHRLVYKVCGRGVAWAWAARRAASGVWAALEGLGRHGYSA